MTPGPKPSLSTTIRGPFKRIVHLVRNPQHLKWELQHRAAYRAFRDRYPFLTEGAHLVDSQKRLLIVNLNTGHLRAQIDSLLAKAVQVRGYHPLVLMNSWCTKARRYYQLCGVRDVVYLDDYFARVPRAQIEEIERAVKDDFQQPLSVQKIKAWEYRGVKVGRATLSSIARRLVRGRIELADPVVKDLLRRWLPRTMQYVRAAEAVLDHIRPHIMLVHEKGYMAEGSIFEAALNRGVNTIYWCHSYRDDALILKRYTPQTKFAHWLSLSPETCDAVREMTWTPQHEEELDQAFQARYDTSPWFLSRRYQDGKVLKSSTEIKQQLGLDPAKKTAVLFSHITWDASFFHGEDLFDDYEDWLVETVKAACANPALNWVVKLHPINVYKYQAENLRGEWSEQSTLRTKIGPLPPHVKFLAPDTDINTFSLFPVTDYCLTVRGTIGVEMACFGIPVLTAGTGRYAGLGFTRDAATRQDYLETLGQLQTVPRLSAAQTLLAKQYAHTLFCRRPARFTSFRTVFREEFNLRNPFFSDLELTVGSFPELAAAQDLAAFAAWAIDSRQEDFFMPAENGCRTCT